MFEPVDVGTADAMGLTALADAAAGRLDLLDDDVEAQVHGVVLIDRDVEALVLDPSFLGTDVEQLARHLPCPIEWHAGARLGVQELDQHAGYRGPEVAVAARAMARDGWLDARVVGDAARAGAHDQQTLKRVWHLVARFGAPVGTGAATDPGRPSRVAGSPS